MSMRKVCLLAFLLLVLLFITACGRRTQISDAPSDNQGRVGNHGVFGHTETLTIAAPEHFVAVLIAAEERLNLERNGFALNIISYTPETLALNIMEQQALLTIGQGADIFFLTPEHDLLNLIYNGLVADINELIATYASHDYFFSNVLEALEIDGGLYTFPINFAFEYVGINANLPSEFIERFAAYDTVTFSRLFALYNELQTTHAEWNHLAVAMGAVSRFNFALHDRISQIINWENETFSPAVIASGHFVYFLNTAHRALADNNRHNTINELGNVLGNPTFENVLSLQSERYAFSFTTQPLDTANALLYFPNPYFIHYIPLAGESGNLFLQQVTNNLFAVNANANGELALTFLMNVVAAWAEGLQGQTSLATPIKRTLFTEHAEAGFYRAATETQAQSGGSQIPEAIARLENYKVMPVTVPKAMFVLPVAMYTGNTSVFMGGAITAREFLQEIEAAINNWFVSREFTEVDPAILEEHARQVMRELEMQELLYARAHLPYKTLSIKAHQNFGFILAQAEQYMNRDWAERGVEYNFNIYVSTHYPLTNEDLENLAFRVATMLMAGQGYDMIAFQPWGTLWPLFSWAESGLLTDIWALIDTNPNTNTDDFYVNVLESFAVNDGLWAFPTSLDFMYIGINAKLPQYFLDRFNAYDTISLRQMMSLYIDLMTDYPHEFGHLHFSSGCKNNHPAETVVREINHFIDLENQVSHLNNAEFVELLRLIQQTYVDLERHPSAGLYTTPFAYDRHIQRLANNFVFSLYSIFY